MAREHCIAWIAEDSDPDDYLMASGRFFAHVETEELELGGSIEDATLDEVLVWARERASAVLIRLWDSDYYSAGTVNPHPDEYPEWTGPPWPAERRRPRGLEALDNTEDDPPVPWDIRFHAAECSDEELLEAVLKDDRLTAAPEQEEGTARVIVHTSTRAQADAIANEVSIKHVHPLSTTTGDGFEVYPVAPDAPVRFGGFRRS